MSDMLRTYMMKDYLRRLIADNGMPKLMTPEKRKAT